MVLARLAGFSRPSHAVARSPRSLRAALAASAIALGASRSDAQSKAAATATVTTAGAPHAASAARVATATRTSTPVTVDGRLDEAAWRGAVRAGDFVQFTPDPNGRPTQATDAYVLYDDEAVYVAMRLHDSAPDSIAAPLVRRDYDGYSDWAQVLIDSYFDRRTAFRFAVNPAGARRDGMFSGDQDWQEDVSWDAVWQVGTSRDSLGWSAEFRIPLTQLRFSGCAEAMGDARVHSPGRNEQGTNSPSVMARAPRCVWGIQFARELARRSERSYWAPRPPGTSGFVSHFGTLDGLRGLDARRRIEVMPYSLARLTRAPADAGNPFHRPNDFLGALGADVKLGVTSNMTLTATLNPDFGQVEADPSEVNLTGVETFFEERRPFFVEGSDIFQFNMADAWFFFGREQLFYSRRIGRVPQGSIPDDAVESDEPDVTTLLGAAKVSGKTASGWSVGALSAVTGEERGRFLDESGVRRSITVEPLTHYGVARAQKDFLSGRAGVGVVVTAANRRLAPDLDSLRSSAYAGGVDWRYRTGSGMYSFSGNLVGSVVNGGAAAITRTQRSPAHYFQRPDAGHLGVDSSRTSLGGMSAELRAFKNGGGHLRWGAIGRVVSSGFEVNDLGFQTRSDAATFAGWLGYDQYTPGRLTRSWALWTNHWSMWSLAGERVLTGSNVFGEVRFHNYWQVEGDVRVEYAATSRTALRGGPALYTPARVGGGGRLGSDPRRMVSGSLEARLLRDRESDGRMLNVGPSVQVRPTSQIELTVAPFVSWSRNPFQYVGTEDANGAERYIVGDLAQTTTWLTTRFNYTFTPNLSFQFYAQPFVSAGNYRVLREVRSARAKPLGERFHTYSPLELRPITGTDDLSIDRTGDGATDLTLENPDFNVGELRSNAVLRWEYRPGSTLYLVWSQGRETEERDGTYSLSRDSRRLFQDSGTNVFLIKASYWIGR